MAIAIIQCIGVFIASWFGTVLFSLSINHTDSSPMTHILFAIGMAMATCGIFF